MAFIRRYWIQIQAYMSQLTPSQKWLIGALVIILLFTGFVVIQYAGAPEMVAISPFAASRGPQVLARLKGAGIDARNEGGQIVVPAGQVMDAHAALAEADLLAPDTSLAFKELIDRQNPWLSDRQNQQAFLVAKMQVLGEVIAKMKDVESADVMIAMPESQGFGRTFNRPSAAVNVKMKGRHLVERHLVDAVAGLVSGAVAEMQPQDVVVIDAGSGHQFTVKSPEDLLPGESLELLAKLEQRYREKVERALMYIRGVIVAVNVQADSIHSKESETRTYDKSEPLIRQSETEKTRTNTAATAEPGARSNTGLDTELGPSTTSNDRETTNESEFGPKPLLSTTHIRETGHNAKQVNVTVNIPRSYFIGLFKERNPANQGDPDAATLLQLVTDELPQIEAQVKPLINTDAVPGVVKVSMVPDRDLLAMTAGAQPVSAAAGLSSVVIGSGWVSTVGLSVLALVSVALMLSMVRKATQRPQLPTAQELAGVPPTLEIDEELIGEAEEHDTSMTGVEINEQELRSRKIVQQISEMVKSNPVEAGAMLNRWVRPEE